MFVGHGNPMNALEVNQFSEKWKNLGQNFPRPKAIVGISAHWETNGTFVTAMENPKTIYDFGGFPRELYEVIYPAKGSPELAKKITHIVKSREIKLDENNWGLDHGIWSILVHLYPDAEIPVVQLSLDKFATPQQHYDLGKELSELRNEGILFVCSGNIIHNLKMVDWKNESNQYNWAKNVTEIVKERIRNKKHASLINFNADNEEFKLAVNSAEHYIPLLYLLGLQQENDEISFFNDTIMMGSLSMTGVLLQ